MTEPMTQPMTQPMTRGTTRRTVLKAIAGPVLLRATGLVTVAGTSLAGCTTDRDRSAVEVFVVWTGGELAAFRAVLADFSAASGRQVRIVPVGEQVSEFLRVRLDANNPPDVAVVPLPGLVREYANDQRAVPLPESLRLNYPQSWLDMVTINGSLYGVWVKAAHKSLFWYRRSALGGRPAPTTWAELVDLVKASAGAGHPALAIGAADGWVVTDWFENALVAVGGGDVYEALVRGALQWQASVVRDALVKLAELWSIRGAFPGGPGRALLTQYEDSVVEVFANRSAGIVFEGDFVAAVIDRFQAAGRVPEPPELFRFPPITTAKPPLVVGGDVATLLSDSRGGMELIQWLADGRSVRPWLPRGGFLSPNTAIQLTDYRTPLGKELATQLRSASEVHFDLSDQVGGRLAGGQGRGMLRILPEFFADASRPGADRDRAVRRAQDQLALAAEQNAARRQ